MIAPLEIFEHGVRPPLYFNSIDEHWLTGEEWLNRDDAIWHCCI